LGCHSDAGGSAALPSGDFYANQHLLIVWEQASARNEETLLEDLPPSALRNLTGQLTFVPAVHVYRDWQQPARQCG
jgi:AraC family transcriptional regulator